MDTFFHRPLYSVVAFFARDRVVAVLCTIAIGQLNGWRQLLCRRGLSSVHDVMGDGVVEITMGAEQTTLTQIVCHQSKLQACE